MQSNTLQRKHSKPGKKRVGRGGKKGTYSGKGIKGQKSRAGRKMVPIIRELIKRYPKLKGYRTFVLDKGIEVVNLSVLEEKLKDGDTVTPEILLQKGLVVQIKGKTPKIKILGTGTLTKKLIVENCLTSKTAQAAIEKAGGTVK